MAKETKYTFEALTIIRKWATARQAEYIDALLANGVQFTQVAEEKGVTRASVYRSIIALIHKVASQFSVPVEDVEHSLDILVTKAAMLGYSPDHDMVHMVPDPFEVKGVSTYYDKDGKPRGQWVKSRINHDKKEAWVREFVETLTNDVRGLSPLVSEPVGNSTDVMSVYPMGDPHFGMRAWAEETGADFDLKIAAELTYNAVDRLVMCAPPSEIGLLINLGDMFHADNQKNQTNSGHQLDVDGRWAKVQQVGLKAMIRCVQRMLEKHKKVIVRINRGNHDGHSAYALAIALSCYFENQPRVEVDLNPSLTWYYQFGKTLIGSTHGDTIAGKNLPGVMAADEAIKWGSSQHRYWYVGHVHHQDQKEYPGCVVEYFRTLAARDAWHAGQGYHAGRDMRVIVIDKEHGELYRHRVDVGMLK